jgi:DNA-binding MarR family transcriptional regulator
VTALDFDPTAEARRQWSAHGWNDAAAGMAAVTSIMRAQQVCLRRVNESLAPFGLTFARYEALRLLAFTRMGALPLGKMGNRLQVNAGSITNAIDRLERDGLVERRPHDDDGRVVLAVLTDAGRVLVEDATVAINNVFTSLGLADNDLDTIVSLVARLAERAATVT